MAQHRRDALAMPRDSRVTDQSDHGGMILTGSPTFVDENRPSARVNDLHFCPQHGVTPILTGSPRTMVNGRRNARMTSVCACGAVIIAGASKCITD